MKSHNMDASKQEPYVLKLFVSHKMPESVTAAAELKALFDREFAAPFSMDVIDITENPDVAVTYSVVAVPMLILLSPEPKVTIIGSLRDKEKIFAALRFRRDG